MRLFYKYLTFIFIFTSISAFASTYPLTANTEVFGSMSTVTPKKNDTFSYYAHTYDVGAFAIINANPGINENYPDKQTKPITIPGEFILPTKQDGIVINLPELRLYYFTPGELHSYPVSIGRVGWKTPIQEGKIVQKEKDPSWIVPDSILAESEAKGHPIAPVYGPGPKNPLGRYAMHLSIPGYLIHGTNAPTSIGRRVSHGCIRMFPNDIEELFNLVPVGTPVALINEPVKAGWRGNELNLEIHPILAEYPMSDDQLKTLVTDTINNAAKGKTVKLDANQIDRMIKQKSGIVEVIAKG
ncbi:MAG: L,D-transpeptidase family protein [Gammaproteobacteria bacterium]